MAQLTGVKKTLQREVKAIEIGKRVSNRPTSVYDVYKQISPELEPPKHLDPYVVQLDKAALVGSVEKVFHAPPQHGKTIALEHAYIFAGIVRPGLRHAYSTYNAVRAREILMQTKQLAFKAGLDPHSRDGYLFLSGGTKIKFVGATTGSLTGEPIDGMHGIDDPLKDRKEALSLIVREDRWNWLHDVAQTRRHPGSSTFVMMTRWVTDDLAGRVIARMGWDYIRLAAECDSEDDPLGRQIGEALWPSQRPMEWLAQFKSQPLTWASMYQGRPRPIGDTLFGEPVYYDRLPATGGYKVLYGADLAYTKKTRADWSILLKGRLYGPDLYLTQRLSKQVQADVFTRMMAQIVTLEPGPVLWYGSTTERGAAQLIRQQIPTFRFRLATADKYVRAMPTAEKLWNPGRVLLPTRSDWVNPFIAEVCEFTGQGDLQDDNVDALAALGDLAIQATMATGMADLNRDIMARMRGQGRKRQWTLKRE